MTKEKLLTTAINTYGHMPQKLMAIEEMSELAIRRDKHEAQE